MNQHSPATIPIHTDAVRHGPVTLRHLIEEVAREDGFDPLPCWTACSRPPPMIDSYRKKVFSTRACRWYPDVFFHRRRPTSLTATIVRSRALDRGPYRDTLAVLVGGTTTVAPRAPAAA
jgi:hypothetical protein